MHDLADSECTWYSAPVQVLMPHLDAEDMQIHALHALRLGLCFKVDRGDLTVSQATDFFENMRSSLIDAKAREKEDGLEEGENQKKDLQNQCQY